MGKERRQVDTQHSMLMLVIVVLAPCRYAPPVASHPPRPMQRATLPGGAIGERGQDASQDSLHCPSLPVRLGGGGADGRSIQPSVARGTAPRLLGRLPSLLRRLLAGKRRAAPVLRRQQKQAVIRLRERAEAAGNRQGLIPRRLENAPWYSVANFSCIDAHEKSAMGSMSGCVFANWEDIRASAGSGQAGGAGPSPASEARIDHLPHRVRRTCHHRARHRSGPFCYPTDLKGSCAPYPGLPADRRRDCRAVDKRTGMVPTVYN